MDKKQITYIPQGGVCSRRILIDLEDHTITQLRVERGCSGNSLGIAALIKGMTVEEAISRLEGIKCGGKETSCPDQLAKALKAWLKEEI